MKVHMHQQSGSLKQWTMITQWDGVSVREQSYHSDWWPMTCHTLCFQGLREWGVIAACLIPWITWKMLSRCPWASHLLSSRSSGGAQWVTHDWDRTQQMSDVSGCALEKVAMGVCWRCFKQCDHWPLFPREKREMFPTRSNKRGKNRQERRFFFSPSPTSVHSSNFKTPVLR